jgi:hypothetical protein
MTERTAQVVAIVFVIIAAVDAPIRAQDRSGYQRGDRTRALIGGAGIGYRPPWTPTRADVVFAAAHPRLGWFVADRVEVFGEATVFLYSRPPRRVTAGVAAMAGKYHLRGGGRFIPYLHGGVGLLWTSLDVAEIDRTFNFQHFFGIGWRQNRLRGPRLVVELRNHHISNAGTAGDNLGVNAIVALTGVEWLLR